MVGIFWRIFCEVFLGGIFLGGFLGGIFLGGFFGEFFGGGFFGEEYFWRNYLVEINKKLMFLSRFLGNFVSMQEGRKEDKFRSLEVQRLAHRT